SHTVSGLVPCDACGAAFTVTRPAEVCYLAGRRHYACTEPCRQQLLRESHGARLGDELDAITGPPPTTGHVAESTTSPIESPSATLVSTMPPRPSRSVAADGTVAAPFVASSKTPA